MLPVMSGQPLVGGGDDDEEDDDDDEPVEGEKYCAQIIVCHMCYLCVYNVLAILQEDDPVSDVCVLMCLLSLITVV